jgi:hypothetical protein
LNKKILFVNGINTIAGGAGKNSLSLWEKDLLLNNFKVDYFHTSQSSYEYINDFINFLKHIPGVFFRIFYKISIFEYFHKISFVHIFSYIYFQLKKNKDLVLLSHHSTFYFLFFSYFNKPAIIVHDLIYLKAKNQKNSSFFCKLTFKFETFLFKKASFVLVQSYKEKRMLDLFFKGSLKIYLVKASPSDFIKTDFKSSNNSIALVADWRRSENIHGIKFFFNKEDCRLIAKDNIYINVWGYGSSSISAYLKKILSGNGVIVKERGAFVSFNEINDKFLLVPIFHGSGIKIKVLEAIFQQKVIITTPRGIEGLFRIKSKIINVVNSFSQFVEIFSSLCHEEYKESDFLSLQQKYDKYFDGISSVLLKYEQ